MKQTILWIPSSIGDCFNESIRPLGLKAHYLLTIYREFNKAAFHNMESVLAEANEVLIEIGVMPNLDMRARNRELAKQKREAELSIDDSQASALPDRSRGKTEITRKIQAAGVPVRCSLASKIDSIDKLFFVNSKGEKAVELTRMRLAQELKTGSVKILTEGSLVGRAMESVISNLRDTAQSQEPDAAVN